VTVTVRPATPADAATLVALVRELAAYEREPLSSVKMTEADVLRDGFGPERRFEALIAEADGRAAGFALFFHNYSTWEGRAGLYIEDIYVSEWARGLGVGRRLVAEVAAIARERGCPRVDLWVLHWNPARKFYDRMGFTDMSDWKPYRLSGDALAKVAAEAGGEETEPAALAIASPGADRPQPRRRALRARGARRGR
jgi:GNAT superfamily N-acetyltransferase